jgi:hypothetical protein
MVCPDFLKFWTHPLLALDMIKGMDAQLIHVVVDDKVRPVAANLSDLLITVAFAFFDERDPPEDGEDHKISNI